jgi:Replicative DNA helicase
VEKIKITDNKSNKKQPSNLEAEQALLGSIFVNNDIIDEIANIIKPISFYDPAHTKIYEVIETLNNKGMIANPITLKNFFEKDNMLSEVGGTEYLVKLTRFSGSIKQSLDYAKVIHEMYLRRELILISDNLSSETLNTKDQSAEKIIEGTEKSLFDLAERGSFSQSFLKFNQALDQTIEMATLAMKNDKGIVGVPTGLTALDEKLGGLHKSDLVILAGRPSMGKTALATNIAYHAAQKIMRDEEKSSVAFFSLEMSSEQLSTRILSEQARIRSDDIRRGKVTEEKINRYIETSRNI